MKYIDAEKLIAELRKHLIPTVVDGDYDEWEQGKDAGSLQAIDIVESLQQEQPEVDLEKEVTRFVSDDKILSRLVKYDDALLIARHFWKKGYNARKED